MRSKAAVLANNTCPPRRYYTGSSAGASQPSLETCMCSFLPNQNSFTACIPSLLSPLQCFSCYELITL